MANKDIRPVFKPAGFDISKAAYIRMHSRSQMLRVHMPPHTIPFKTRRWISFPTVLWKKAWRNQSMWDPNVSTIGHPMANKYNMCIYIHALLCIYVKCAVCICIKWYDICHILKISIGLGWWRWSHHPLAPRATFQERLKVDDGALAEVLREEGGDEAEAPKEAAKEAGGPKWSLASSKIPKRESLSLKRFQTWSFLQDYDPKTWVTWILFRYIRYNIYNLRNKDTHA